MPDEKITLLTSRIEVMKPFSIKVDDAKALMKKAALYDSKDYVAEEKVDGCHYFTVASCFFSTEKVEKTNNYPHLRDFLKSLNMPNLILDGEVNYPGKTSQFCTRVTGSDPSNAIEFQNGYGPIHYTFWDMLRTPKGTWLLNMPYIERRKILEYFYDHHVKGTPMEKYIHISRICTTNKRAFYDDIIASGGEGTVLKKIDSPYIMGKKPAWLWVKDKAMDYGDLFITGYDEPAMEYKGTNFDNWPYWKNINGVDQPVSKYFHFDWIGALELSAYVDGVVTKICSCAGLNDDIRKRISESKDFFNGKVVKISFMEKTEAGYPRHPRFEEFHEGKTAQECTWELN